jgi:hypothetical protein
MVELRQQERSVTMSKTKNPSESPIRDTLLSLANSANSPRDLMSAVRKAHPDAKKKEVIRAAFAAMIELSDRQPFTAKQLQDFAISNRGSEAE